MMFRPAFLGLAAAIAMVVAPAAASAQSVGAPTASDVRVRLTQADNGRVIEVPVMARFAVELVGTPTAGYVWKPVLMADFLTRAGEATGNTTRAQSQPGFTGGNHWEVFYFAALEGGRGEIALVKARPWETSEPPVDVFRVTIVAR